MIKNGEKLPVEYPLGLTATYIGNKIRYSGTYDEGSRGYFGEDYEPPTFTNKKRYIVYQIRIDANSKILEALPSSVRCIESTIKIGNDNNVNG